MGTVIIERNDRMEIGFGRYFAVQQMHQRIEVTGIPGTLGDCAGQTPAGRQLATGCHLKFVGIPGIGTLCPSLLVTQQLNQFLDHF